MKNNWLKGILLLVLITSCFHNLPSLSKKVSAETTISSSQDRLGETVIPSTSNSELKGATGGQTTQVSSSVLTNHLLETGQTSELNQFFSESASSEAKGDKGSAISLNQEKASETQLTGLDYTKVQLYAFDGDEYVPYDELGGENITVNQKVLLRFDWKIPDTSLINIGAEYTIELPKEYFTFKEDLEQEIIITAKGEKLNIGKVTIKEIAGKHFLVVMFNDAIKQTPAVNEGYFDAFGHAAKTKDEKEKIIVGGHEIPGVVINPPNYTTYPATGEEYFGQAYKYGWQSGGNGVTYEIQINTDNYVQNLVYEYKNQQAAEKYKNNVLSSAKEPLMIYDDLHPDLEFSTVKPMEMFWVLFEMDLEGKVYDSAAYWLIYQSTQIFPNYNQDTYADFETKIKNSRAGTWGIYKGSIEAGGPEQDRLIVNAGHQIGAVATNSRGDKNNYLQVESTQEAFFKMLDEDSDKHSEELEQKYKDLTNWIIKTAPSGAPHMTMMLNTKLKAGRKPPTPTIVEGENGQEQEVAFPNEVAITGDNLNEGADVTDELKFSYLGAGGVGVDRDVLEIEKRSTSGELLDGVAFVIKKMGTLEEKTYLTSKGKLKIEGLAPGNYRISEKSSVEGHKRDLYVMDYGKLRKAEEKDLTFTIGQPTTDGKKGTIHFFSFYNEKEQETGNLTVHKNWQGDTEDHHKRQTVKVQLQQAFSKETNEIQWKDVVNRTIDLTKDNNYTATFTDLPKRDSAGDLIQYRVVETNTVPGYVSLGPSTSYDWNQPEKPLILTNRYHVIANLVLTKVAPALAYTGMNEPQPLADVIFELWQDSDSVNKKVIQSNQQGEVILTDLIVGKYTLKEVKGKDGYDDTVEITFEVKPDLTIVGLPKEFQIENKLKDTTLMLKKTDTNGVPLTGAKFSIYPDRNEDKKLELEEVQGEQGYYQVAGLPAGKYFLTETCAPAGYQLLDAPLVVIIRPDGTATIDGKPGKLTLNSEKKQENLLEVTLKNQRSFTLPEAGANGLKWQLAIMLIAVSSVAALMIHPYLKRKH